MDGVAETKLAIGFVRFESLGPGFEDSGFESIGKDSAIPNSPLKEPNYEHFPFVHSEVSQEIYLFLRSKDCSTF